MTATRPPTDTMKMTDAKQQFSRVVNTVFRTRRRVLVEKGGIPVAAIVSTADLERLNQLDAEWEHGFEVLDEIGAAFEGVDPDEIERETAKALAEVRAEMRAG
jgi:prevent-host-death family protein